MKMFDLEKWQEIYHTLAKHKLRTALTAFGVFWGIFMLTVLLGIGNGLRNDALSGFGGNTNTVYLWVGDNTQIPYQGLDKGRWVQFKSEDISALKARIPELDLALGINELGGWQQEQYIVRKDRSDAFITRGTHPEVASMNAFAMVRGRFVNHLDVRDTRKVAVIGERVYETLFAPGEDPIGESIKIGGIHVKVIGVFKPTAAGDNAIRQAQMVLIPNSTLRSAFNQSGYVGSLRLTPLPGESSAVLADKAIVILQERHQIHPDDTTVLGHWNTEELYQQIQGLFFGISAFSWFVAVGTVMAGVFGVGNIMLIVVKERTREIGLRKALGATSGSIVALVLLEAVVITTVAGYLGLVAGVFLLEVIQAMAEGQADLRFLALAEFEFGTALLAIFILVLAGMLAALLPARKAARVNPIVALQDQ